ncbi:MAG: AI-2E family transporter [Thomasclavelia sp.]|nr:AI-2E family transporter [Thomasclavelia sp.]
MERTKDKNILLGIIIIILIIFGLIYFDKIWGYIKYFIVLLAPAWIGMSIAYVLNIPIKKLNNILKDVKNKFVSKHSSSLSVFIVLVVAIVLIVLFIAYVIPAIFNSILDLFSNLNGIIKDIVGSIDGICKTIGTDYRLSDSQYVKLIEDANYTTLFNDAAYYLKDYIPQMLKSSTSILNIFTTFLSAIMFAMYCLGVGGMDATARQVKKVIVYIFGYDKAKYIENIGHQANQIFTVFVSKRVLESAILAVLFYIGMRIFGFPYPELNTLILFLLSFIPYFGSILANIIGAILMLSKTPMTAVYFTIYFQIITNFETYVIYPKIVGDSLGVSGFYVLLSIVIFGDWFGMVGMLLSVPIAAVIQVVLTQIINDKLKSNHIKVTAKSITKTS